MKPLFAGLSLLFAFVAAVGGAATKPTVPPDVSIPIWVPAGEPTLLADCQTTTAFPPVTYWPQNGERTYVLRAYVSGRGTVAVGVTGSPASSVSFDAGQTFQPITVTAHHIPAPNSRLQVSVTLIGDPDCPSFAYLTTPNLFASP